VELKRYVIDGVPLQSLMSSTQGMPKRAGIDNFNAGVPQETMSIILSDNGIVDIEWREPLERVDVMNPDIELAPCNEVMDVFYQELSNAYGSWETSNEDYISKDRYGGTVCWHSHAPSKLYDIRLDYGLARIPNNNREFMAIPLWDFYSRLNLKKTYTSSNGAVTKCEWVEESSLLTLNGIDNTRFNRREGY
jgi:hypothetical protein